MEAIKIVKGAVQWLLAIFSAILVISGLGITEYRYVENLTLGALSRSTSFSIHTNSWTPFLVLLAMHIGLKVYEKFGRSR